MPVMVGFNPTMLPPHAFKITAQDAFKIIARDDGPQIVPNNNTQILFDPFSPWTDFLKTTVIAMQLSSHSLDIHSLWGEICALKWDILWRNVVIWVQWGT